MNNVNGLLFGGDYSPEQWLWDPQSLDKDIKLMQELKVNVVSMGMFAWSRLEPEEGRYDFGWLGSTIDRLYEAGIYTMLATPSGARPAWLAKKYPEVLRVDNLGRRQQFGARHNHCYTSPVYREKVARINTALAEAFGTHPGVILWHISNEYGGECHCDLCQAAFRGWLRDKYGSLDKLNHSWWNGFWSHVITDWDEINAPSPIGEDAVEGLNMDWRRFVTQQTLDFYRHEVASVRAVTPDLPVTTNFHDFINIGQSIDYWAFADDIDVISWDNYPLWHNDMRSDGEEAARRALIHNICRSFKQKPFLLLESCPGPTNWQPVAKLPKPGVVVLSSMQAVSLGSDSVQFFQVKRSLGGSEKFHGALIDHYPTNKTRIHREAEALGSDLARLGGLQGARTKARAAIIYDWENKWALDNVQGLNRHRRDYFDFCVDQYRPLWERGVAVDVLKMGASFAGYKIVIAPMLYMLPEAVADELGSFVERGGTLVTGPFSGVVDENLLCYTNGRPGPLRDLLGIWSEETDSLYDSERNSVVDREGQTYDCKYFCDLLHVDGAEALMIYEEDFYRGRPAVTRNRFGEGQAFYFASIFEEGFYDAFYGQLLSEVLPGAAMELPRGVTAATRSTDTHTYTIYQNFTGERQELVLQRGGKDQLGPASYQAGDRLWLMPWSYSVLGGEL